MHQRCGVLDIRECFSIPAGDEDKQLKFLISACLLDYQSKEKKSPDGRHFSIATICSTNINISTTATAAAEADATVKPLNWRTRICMKWEYSGY
nr:hypothetical protein [Tanacetum cinerariifolium]